MTVGSRLSTIIVVDVEHNTPSTAFRRTFGSLFQFPFQTSFSAVRNQNRDIDAGVVILQQQQQSNKMKEKPGKQKAKSADERDE
jgi:hypothetical protein